MNHIRNQLFLLLISTMLASCVSIKETHLFKDNTPNIPNYYKLQVKGWTSFSKTKYVSGYFDEEAVNEYFGEFDQPASYTFIKKTEKPSNDAEGNENTKLSGELSDKKLVMILSSNSKAVADQIGAIAENQQLNAALMSIATRDKVLDYQREKIESENSKKLIQSAIASFDAAINNLSGDSSVAYNEVHLVSAINILLIDVSKSDKSITDLDQLSSVLKEIADEN